MITTDKYNTENEITWCSGCGNFGIHAALKQALVNLKKDPSEVVITFDIGCNGNGAEFIDGFRLKGLHGRSLPLAAGAHLANSKMSVIADIGDGGCLHEGIEHLIHAIRSNYDITVVIHNNENFALTTGQATATTKGNKDMYGFPDGKQEGSINIGELVLSLNPSFFARGYSAQPQQLTDIFQEAIKHKGLSVVEVIQLCPTFNKESTPQWFNERIKSTDKKLTISEAIECVKNTQYIYTGIIYQNKNMPDYYNRLKNRKGRKSELINEVKNHNISNILSTFQ